MEMEGKKKHVLAEEDKTDVKKQKIPSREERLEMYMSTFKNRKMLEEDDEDDEIQPDGSHSLTFRDFASLELDMYESEGFDVQDYTKVNDAGMIRTYYDPLKGLFCENYLPEVTDCAGLAIQQYNTEKGKQFAVTRVIKANVEPVCPYRYYITFEALDATEGIVEFQAIIDIHIPITEREVLLVRISQPPRLFSLPLAQADDTTASTMFHCCRSNS